MLAPHHLVVHSAAISSAHGVQMFEVCVTRSAELVVVYLHTKLTADVDLDLRLR